MQRANSSMSLVEFYERRMAAYHTQSVHGGAGGRNVHLSYAVGNKGLDLSHALLGNADAVAFGLQHSERIDMQNLNDRLATYLDKVRTLEKSNAKLELQIREWYEKRIPTSSDYSKYQAVIEDLHKKISIAKQDKARMNTQYGNAELAAEDFKLKYDTEIKMREMVQGDTAVCRKELDKMTIQRSDLEMQIENLTADLVHLKKNHTEDKAALQAQLTSSSVNVEVDAGPQEELTHILADIRTKYENIIERNRIKIDTWYKGKFEDLQKQMSTSTKVLQTSHADIDQLRRDLHRWEIELESEYTKKTAMEGSVHESEARSSIQLSKLQTVINNLQAELGRLHDDVARQGREYKILLDIKTRLEMEIAEYRRLLDGESTQQTIQTREIEHVDGQVVVESHRKVVKVIKEVIVDGQVVAHEENVKEQVE